MFCCCFLKYEKYIHQKSEVLRLIMKSSWSTSFPPPKQSNKLKTIKCDLRSNKIRTKKTGWCSKMSGKFRHTIYDPILIILQIITLTALFYFSLTILIYFIDLLFDFDVNISQLFNYKLIGLNNSYNFSITTVFVLNSLVGYVFYWRFFDIWL